MSGRQAAIHQINEIAGPTLTNLPVRTVFDWEQSIEAYSDRVQREMTFNPVRTNRFAEQSINQ